MSVTILVARRFCGPSTSANGGYICGLIARVARRPVTVRLMAPPPLDTALDVTERDGLIEVTHDGQVLARARPGDVGDLVPPAAPGHAAAAAAAERYAGYARHPAPTCFVCGPRRPERDGLAIYPGRLSDPALDGVVAAPWMPDESLDAGDGMVASEFIWAALDCPGFDAAAPDMRLMLLGELTARLEVPVHAGEPCVVVGWRLGASGRKHEAGTALYGAGGELKAVARAIWIEPRG